MQLCDGNFFYYSGDSKIFLKHSLNEVWIVFEQDNITKELAEFILKNYSFINVDFSLIYDCNIGIFGIIDEKCDCKNFKNYLMELNDNDEIFSATPVFYLSDDVPDSYWILMSEVLTKHNDELISESDFINFAETFGLELIDSKYSTQHFKVKDVKTGFEALEIANQIYESGKIQYSHPNFIAKIVLW